MESIDWYPIISANIILLMTSYQSAQYGGSRPGGILPPEEVAAIEWANFVISRYGNGKDYIV